MPVELPAEVEDDAFPGPGRHPPLQRPDQSVDDRNRHHAETQVRQESNVLFGDGTVDELTYEDGRNEGQERDDQDRDQHHDQVATVGPAVCQNSPQQGAINVRTILLFVVAQVSKPVTTVKDSSSSRSESSAYRREATISGAGGFERRIGFIRSR